MLPAEAFEMRTVVLTLFAEKTRQKPEAVLKNYELFFVETYTMLPVGFIKSC